MEVYQEHAAVLTSGKTIGNGVIGCNGFQGGGTGVVDARDVEPQPYPICKVVVWCGDARDCKAQRVHDVGDAGERTLACNSTVNTIK